MEKWPKFAVYNCTRCYIIFTNVHVTKSIPAQISFLQLHWIPLRASLSLSAFLLHCTPNSLLTSYPSCFLVLSAVRAYVSLPFCITILTQVSYNLSFILKEDITSNGSGPFLQFMLMLASILPEQPPPLLIMFPCLLELSITSSEPSEHLRTSLPGFTPGHLSHTKLIFSVNLPLILLHLLCVHSLPWYSVWRLDLPLLLHREQGYYFEYTRVLSTFLLTKIFIFAKVTLRFPSNLPIGSAMRTN